MNSNNSELPSSIGELIPIGFDVFSAALNGDITTIKFPTSRQTLDEMNKGGWTPLMYAVSCQHEQIVEFLLNNGANAVRRCKNGMTPLMIACRHASRQLVHLLLQYTSSKYESIEVRDDNGWTSLFHAVYMGQEETMKYLIQIGANVNIVDKSNRSILKIASDITNEGSSRILNILQNVINPSILFSPRNDVKYASQQTQLFRIFKTLNIEKYWEIFKDKNIGITDFVRLTEQDLMDLGVRLLGPRRKMVVAISKLNEIYFQSK